MRSIKNNPIDNEGLGETIRYLVHEIEKYCGNQKPLITHCIRVAFRLDFYGYNKKVVQAALLHDLLEDTKASIKEIEKKFGKKVAQLVLESTFDQEIVGKENRYKENFKNALKYGNEALVIRASDLIDNSFYYPLVHNKRIYEYLIKKLSYFLKISKRKIGKEKIFHELEDRLVILKK